MRNRRFIWQDGRLTNDHLHGFFSPTLTFKDPQIPFLPLQSLGFQQYYWTMVGGSIEGGLASELRKKLYSMIGGSLNGGLAAEIRKAILSMTQGGLVGGLALQAKGYLFIMTAGALDSGAADYEWIPGIQEYEWIMQGGSIQGGIFDLLRKNIFIGIGGLEAGGEVSYCKIIPFAMSGGIVDGGKAIILGTLECVTGEEIPDSIVTVKGKLLQRVSGTTYLEVS